MIQKSIVILKPDALERRLAGAIISRLEQMGLSIVAARLLTATDAILRAHYPDSLAEVIGKKSQVAGTDVGGDPAAYGRMVLDWNRRYMMRGSLLAMVVEGNLAIGRIRRLVGNTDPCAAEPGTLRFEFGCDSIARANKEKRGTENLVHASGSSEEAEVEMKLWFPALETKAQ